MKEIVITFYVDTKVEEASYIALQLSEKYDCDVRFMLGSREIVIKKKQ